MATDTKPNDLDGMSLEQLQALKRAKMEADDSGEMQQSKSTGAPLQGFVDNFTPEMHKSAARITRNVFPQKDDSQASKMGKEVTYLPQALANGAESIPEDLANFAGGSVQQMAGVPQQNRVTFADVMRKLDPGFVSPGEINRSPEFQQGLQANPGMQAAWNPLNFAGSFLAPVGKAEDMALQGAKFVGDAIPTAQMAGKAVQQIAQNLPQMQRVLKYAPRVSPTLHGAATGAGYGAAFTGGQQFGQNKTMPTAQQTAGNAGAGAFMGASVAHGVNMLQKLLFRAKLASLAAKSQLPNLPEAAPTAQKDVLPAAPVMKSNLQSITYKNLARNENGAGPRSDQHKAAVQKRIFDYARGKVGEESDEHQQAVSDVNRDYQKERLSQTKVQDRRQYSQGQKQESRQYSAGQTQERRHYSEGQRDTGFERTGVHTDTSGEHFRDLSDSIDSATSHEELRAIEDNVFDPGRGPTGTRLLDSGQQRKLERRIHDRHRALTEAEGSAGESEGTPPSSPAVPGNPEPTPPHNSPVSPPPADSSSPAPATPPGAPPAEPKTASPANPTEAPHTVPEKPQSQPGTPKTPETKPEPAYQPIRDFIMGCFRKTMSVKQYGNRENRYKLAVSVDALGHAAGLSQDKITALEKWVGDAAATRREQTYQEKQLEQLVEWAYKHEDEWIGGRGKVDFKRTEDKNGDYVQLLSHAEREGKFKTIALRTKMERYFERKTETTLEAIRVNLERYGFKRAGEEPPAFKVDARPTVNVTTNGIATKGEWQENLDGSLKLFGDIKEMAGRDFVPPKNADELFDRAERLMNRIGHFKSDMGKIKFAKGDHNHLGDGTTAADVMQEAFDKLQMKGKPGQTPTVHVWHIDKADHVSTVRFDQPKSRSKWPQHMKDLEDKFKLLESKLLELRGKDGKYDYDAIWANSSSLLRGFTGLEAVPIVAMFASKQIHKVAAGIGRNTTLRAMTVGTIDDILRGNARFGGDDVSAGMHKMLGEITSSFFNDSAGVLQKVNGAEELSEMLNQFKGVKATRSNYRKAARDLAEKEGKTTQVEVDEAYRRADTAFMIRQKYNQFAKQVQEHIDEMDIRRKDSKDGTASPEGKKFYTDDDFHDDRKVRKSAYDELYHKALNELHDGLTLQASSGNVFDALLGAVASRKSTSIMANNPRVALKNLFDQAPITMAYYGKHFFTAAADLAGGGALAEAIDRTPIIPQADMTLAKMAEEMRQDAGREPEDAYQWSAQALKKVNQFLSTKIDPLFKGKAPLVSAADRMYTRVSAVASLHKIAERYGMDRHQFIEDLMAHRFTKDQESAIWAEVSQDLSKLYNSVAPHLNKDLFANSTGGKMTNQYATPGRRGFRVMWDWARSDNPEDKMRFAAAFLGFVALGGSGAVPNSLQMVMRLAGAATGANEPVQQTLNNFDQMNMLRQSTGIDYSSNFGPDIATGAQPALQGLQQMYEKGAKAAGEGDAGKFAAGTLLEGLSLLPKQGPFGFDVWQSGLKDLEGAQQNQMKYYFNAGPTQSLKSVTVTGFDYNDAMRKFLFGGASPKAFPMIQAAKMAAAENADAKFQANRDIIPTKSTASTTNPIDVFPRKSEI